MFFTSVFPDIVYGFVCCLLLVVGLKAASPLKPSKEKKKGKFLVVYALEF